MTQSAQTVPRAKSSAQKSPQPGRKLKIGLVGFGTVGRSVAKLLTQDAAGPFQLTHVCNRNVARKKVDWLPGVRWTESVDEIIASDADIFVELVGGIEPAGTWIRKALQAGKSVVTANKLLIADQGPELQQLAREKGCRLEFGASVAGGIPAIIAIEQGLAGDNLYKIAGILNGTCNYILTQMEASGATFESALKEAQRLGFAEADPKDDVEGYDARAKLVVLAQVGLRLRVRPDQIPCRPVYSVGAVDFAYARELNCTIRQISVAVREQSDGVRLSASVQPALVPLSSLVAHVQGSKNLVVATGEFAGQILLSGYGAGGEPTAVAVVSDLHSIARAGGSAVSAAPERPVQVPGSVSGECTVPHYLRLVVRDRPGIVAEVSAVLSRHGISIDALLQKPGYPHTALPFIITLESCSSAVLDRALEEIARLDFHVEPPLCLPIYLD